MTQKVKAVKRVYIQHPQSKQLQREIKDFIYWSHNLLWNRETESWEMPARARWHECGEPLAAVNRLCTKLIGHGGEHGLRTESE